jgi:pimeloyl-ACP methyl ester carboxylesterase
MAGLIALLTGGCVDRIILYPSTQTIAAPGAQRRLVAASSGVVEVWVKRSAGVRGAEPGGFVLQFAGNATRAEQAAEAGAEIWRDWPVEVWSMNYPGYGGSTGPARLRAIPPAALAVYDQIAKAANGKPVFVLGNSLGTTAALHVAANRPVAGLVLKNPPAVRQMILGEYGWWNLWVLAGLGAASVPSELNSVANGRRVRVPAVFVLADGDHVVPPKYQQKVFAGYAGEKRAVVLEGADHNTPLEDGELQLLRDAMRWLWETSRR